MKKITEINDLTGAVVVNNCGELRLATGEPAYWAWGISPEDARAKTRDYFEWDEKRKVERRITLDLWY
jgi:hypothetical protein